VGQPFDVLLVEDDPGDVDLTREALKEAKMMVNLTIVEDGESAIAYLRKEEPYTNAVRPDLILLDLHLPRKDGREVLRELKNDTGLRTIPVVILTSSQANADILDIYGLGGNCYVTKPVGFAEFSKVVRSIEDFWFTVVKLPSE
jgi:two-component system, chemotaxis family, response regulator Rcp1